MAKKTNEPFDFTAASKKANASKLAKSAIRGKLDGKAGSMGKDTPKPIAKMTDAEKKRRIMSSGQVLEAGIPVGKVFQAATRLMAAGNIGTAAQLASRVAAKRQGWARAKAYARTKAAGMAPNSVIPNTGRVGSKAYPKPNKGAR
jgi:hypothetical protein